MQSIACVLVLVFSALLMLQAAVILGGFPGGLPSSSERRVPASLAVVFATVALLTLGLSTWGGLVIEPRAGLSLVQGKTHLLLRLLLVLYGVEAALIGRTAAPIRTEPGWVTLGAVVVACGVGLWSALQYVHPLPGALDPQLTVYGYDTLQPWLVLILVISLAEWLYVVFGQPGLRLRAWLSAALCVGTSLYVLGRLETADTALARAAQHAVAGGPEVSQPWLLVLSVGTAVALALGLCEFLPLPSTPHIHVYRVVCRASVATLLVHPAQVAYVYCFSYADGRLVRGFLFGVTLASLVITFVILARRRRGSSSDGSYFLQSPWLMTLFVASMAAMAAATIDIYFVQLLDLPTDLAISMLGSLVFIEIATDCAVLKEGPLRASQIWGDGSFVRQGVCMLEQGLLGLGRWARAIASAALKGEGRVHLVAVTVGAAVLAAAAFELPNRGRVVVRSFVSLTKEAPDAGVRFSVAFHEQLRKILDGLRSEVLLGPCSETFAAMDGLAVPLRVSALADSRLNARFADAEWEVSWLGKLSFGALIELIKRPGQLLLWSGEIVGGVSRDGDGYQVIASSSYGGSWRIDGKDERALATELAFAVVSSEPAWERGGMTRSLAAFTSFQEGVHLLYDRSEVTRDDRAGTVREAIRLFQQALEVDPAFAMARYRLGATLASIGDFDEAVVQLGRARADAPDLGAAHNAHATLVLGQRAYPRANVLSGALWPGHNQPRALETWERAWLASRASGAPYDEAAAHIGLCKAALFSEQGSETVRGLYHCQVARRIIAALRETDGRRNELDRVESAIHTLLGGVALRLASAGELADHEVRSPLGCDAARADVARSASEPLEFVLPGPLQAEAARSFFEEAVERDASNSFAECRLAEAELALGRPERAGRLARDASMATRLCRELADRVSTEELEEPHVHALALCRRAIGLSPHDPILLNEFAYAFRTMRAHVRGPCEGRCAELGAAAEEYAMRGLALVATRNTALVPYLASTLGEVQMELGQLPEAAASLTRALVAAEQRGSTSDEIRWDLIDVMRRMHTCEHEKLSVLALADDVRASEAWREDRPFTAKLDEVGYEEHCRARAGPRETRLVVAKSPPRSLRAADAGSAATPVSEPALGRTAKERVERGVSPLARR